MSAGLACVVVEGGERFEVWGDPRELAARVVHAGAGGCVRFDGVTRVGPDDERDVGEPWFELTEVWIPHDVIRCVHGTTRQDRADAEWSRLRQAGYVEADDGDDGPLGVGVPA